MSTNNTAKTATAITPVQEVRNSLAAMKPQFQRALPKSVDPDKFLRVAETAIATTPSLANADRTSLFAACTRAAQDGLLPDGREGALVEFNAKNANGSYSKKVQWMPMIQGLMKLARNSGEISNFTAEVVYKNDKFTYRIGIDEMPIHEPDWFATDRGEPVGAWAMISLKDGEKIVKVMPKSKIMKIAGKTKNAAQYDPETGAYFDEWWRKTAFKNVLKYAPRSTDLDRIIQRENEEFGIDNFEQPITDITPSTDTDETGTPVKKPVANAVKKAPPSAETDGPKAGPTPGAKGTSNRLNALKQANKAPVQEVEPEDEGAVIEGEFEQEEQDGDVI